MTRYCTSVYTPRLTIKNGTDTTKAAKSLHLSLNNSTLEPRLSFPLQQSVYWKAGQDHYNFPIDRSCCGFPKRNKMPYAANDDPTEGTSRSGELVLNENGLPRYQKLGTSK